MSYTVLNTILFSLIGLFIYFFFAYKYLKFRKIKIDFSFIKTVFLLVFIGSLLRLFSEPGLSIPLLVESSSNLFSFNFYLQYPQLFLLLGLFFILFSEISLYFKNKFFWDYNKFLQTIFLIILVPLLFFCLVNLVHSFYFFFVIVISIFCLWLFVLVFKFTKINLFKSKINQFAFFSQILDGFATICAIYFFPNNFVEEHVLPNFLISTSPFLFLVVKLLVCLFLIYIIDNVIKNNYQNNYFKLFIIILGFTTGLRDLFTIGLFVSF